MHPLPLWQRMVSWLLDDHQQGDLKKMDEFEAWLKVGMDAGWCGPPVCECHDGIPISAAEEEDWEIGQEPCIHILRLYADKDIKAAVEANHAPTVWRATNRGL